MIGVDHNSSVSSGQFWAMNAERSSRALPAGHFVFVHRQVLSIHDEVFLVDQDGTEVVLSHPQWSLSGAGATLEKAKGQLIAEAKDLVVMLAADIESLSPSAVDLLQFALRVSR